MSEIIYEGPFKDHIQNHVELKQGYRIQIRYRCTPFKTI